MSPFEYDINDAFAEYYETLCQLMQRWEHEIVEFKEAKGGYNEDKIGQYFSAISNEANLKGQQYGWFILGISEKQNKHPVGTAFKLGDSTLLEKFKYEISRNTTDGMTFLDIIELFPRYNGKTLRVLMFKIPAAVAGMPTEWKNRYFARNGESLVSLQQYKIDAIRNQERRDWSRQILPGATIAHLDKGAIAFAREQYKEKMNRPHISEEVDAMTDEDFLTKIKLIRDGRITNAAMILLGNSDFDTLFESAPTMMWRLFGADGGLKDYVIFTIPFITVADQIFAKIRNLTYRYVLIGLTQQPAQKPNLPYLLDTSRSILVSSKQQECNQYGSGGADYICRLSETVQDRGAVPGVFIPAAVSERVCVPLLRCEGVLPHLPPEPVPVQEVP